MKPTAVAISIPLLAFALAACGSDRVTVTDSGSEGTDTGMAGDSSTTSDSSGGTDGGGTDSATSADSGAPTDSGATTDGGMLPSGACTNVADEAVMAGPDFETEAEACATGCFAAAMCVTDCMRDDVGLSMGCSVCFGEAGQCAIDNCLTACIADPRAPACTECRRAAGCITDYEACTGLPGE